MASGDLLRQLFRGYAKRDDTTFRAAAEAIIQEERLKNQGKNPRSAVGKVARKEHGQHTN